MDPIDRPHDTTGEARDWGLIRDIDHLACQAPEIWRSTAAGINIVQKRGQQVGDHNAPQKGRPTPSKQMECGFAAGDVASPIFTAAAGGIPKLAGQENITTKDIRTSGPTTGGYFS